jgi:hypothetical protein
MYQPMVLIFLPKVDFKALRSLYVFFCAFDDDSLIF